MSAVCRVALELRSFGEARTIRRSCEIRTGFNGAQRRRRNAVINRRFVRNRPSPLPLSRIFVRVVMMIRERTFSFGSMTGSDNRKLRHPASENQNVYVLAHRVDATIVGDRSSDDSPPIVVDDPSHPDARCTQRRSDRRRVEKKFKRANEKIHKRQTSSRASLIGGVSFFFSSCKKISSQVAVPSRSVRRSMLPNEGRRRVAVTPRVVKILFLIIIYSTLRIIYVLYAFVVSRGFWES